jgi:hypothetical protein
MVRTIAAWGLALATAVVAAPVPAAPALKDRSPVPAGTWTVTYHPNRAVRVYAVAADGGVTFAETPAKAKLADNGKEILLDFKDGKLERWTIGKDGRLFVEHFNPRDSYPAGPPDQIGVGVWKADK